MDRLQQLKGDAGGSKDSTLDTTSLPSESFMTANESSKYFSLSETDTSFDISSIKDVNLTPSTPIPDRTVTAPDDVISNLSPIGKKPSPLESYKIGKQIEAANILSGGVNIFDDNDNSYDGNELVIDDNVIDADEKSNPELKMSESLDLKADGCLESTLVGAETAVESKDTEVVLQIDGKNVDAIDIGNGLYLYRKGQEELAAVQIIDDSQQQPSFKFLKVRENAEGNLEVYEEIEIEVPKELPGKIEKPLPKTGHVPIKNIGKVISDNASVKPTEPTIASPKKEEIKPTVSITPEIESSKDVIDQKFNINLKIKNSESRKSPLSFTPVTYHSTPNKDGVPLTKVMVDLQLQPSRNSDNIKKTIEVHTDSCKQKPVETQAKTDPVKETTEEKPKDSCLLENNKESKVSECVITDPELTALNTIDKSIPTNSQETTEQIQSSPSMEVTENQISSDIIDTNVNLKEETPPNSVFDSMSVLLPDQRNIENIPETEVKGKESESQSEVIVAKIDNEKDIIVHITQTSAATPSEDLNTNNVSKPVDDGNIKQDSEMKLLSNEKQQPKSSNLTESNIGIKSVLSDNISVQNSLSIDKSEKEDIIEDLKTKSEIVINRQSSHIPIKTIETKSPIIHTPTLSVKPEVTIVNKVESTRTGTKIESESNTVDKANIAHIPKVETSLKSTVSKLNPDVSKVKDSKSTNIVDTKKDIAKAVNPSIISNQSSSNQIETLEKKDIIPKTKPVEIKAINNNTPVPFGKWTEANRQAFLNKIKESKVPTTTSSNQQLKQANDLNRRDVLKKIDSQRQSAVNAAAAKAQEQSSKTNVKNENAFSSIKTISQEKGTVKVEAAPDIKNKGQKTYSKIDKQQEPKVTITDSSDAKSDPRKNTLNQNLIDKTIEDMLIKPAINPALPAKQETKPSTKDSSDNKVVTESTKNSKQTSQIDQADVFDAVEKKMNELHGIPFVERPPHELPKLPIQKKLKHSKLEQTSSCNTNLAKANSVPALLPFTKKHQPKDVLDIDEEEIIEHEPITGDIGQVIKQTSKVLEKPKMDQKNNIPSAQKNVVITENDFDKFARRNSKTYEDQLTVNFGNKQQLNVVQTIVEKGIPKPKNELRTYMPQHSKSRHVDSNKNRPNSNSINLSNDGKNKNYNSTNSKLQHAYNMTMNRIINQMQKTSPITIIEDKPVKVVFMDSNQEFVPNQLNVQGAQLSPSKRTPESDVLNLSSCESLDSDMMDAIDDVRLQAIQSKSKHQRKQVLTPVEAPDLELIEPRDIGVHESPKKRRKLENTKNERDQKVIVPKKNYLLGRAETEISSEKNPPVAKTATNDIVKENNIGPNHKSAASAIDSLVKAAELLETQSNNAVNTSSSESTNTPAKRGRGRPRKNPLPESASGVDKAPSPQKKARLTEELTSKQESDNEHDDTDTSSDEMIKENWTMGKINENIVCPICNKLFRSENVVFKHVKHCTGPSPSRSDSDKRSPRRLRRSYEYDLNNDDNSELSDTESEKSISKVTPKKRKSRDQMPKSAEKDEVIVIDDTPIKENSKKDDKKLASKLPIKSKIQYNTSNLVCEFCGKTFRQLSYLVSHKLQHKKEMESKPKVQTELVKKSVFSCEVCKKEFRKLHHMVQHRIIHNPTSMPSRALRKSSSEQHDNKSKALSQTKQSDDQSAGFRCEPCDKSFRKLHHLVEHRETHREKESTTTQPAAAEKSETQHQCDTCKKTFKRMELLIEHKELHLETSSEKSDDKSVQSSLSTRDIIHECSLCYMVFPNEHSLTKHTIICQRKKKHSASKLAKQSAESTEQAVEKDNNELKDDPQPDNKELVVIESEEPATKEKLAEPLFQAETSKDQQQPVKPLRKSKTPDIVEPKPITKDVPKTSTSEKPEEKKVTKPESVKETAAQAVVKKLDNKPIKNKVNEMKRKTPVKDRLPTTVTKRKKSINLPLPVVAENPKVESSDDDEIRYMLNPDFKSDENVGGKQFMKIRASKRSSLQLERPNSKDLIKRRTSLQHPPKISRLKATKPVVTDLVSNTAVIAKTSKPDPVPSTDSDDSDVKYSIPKTTIKEPETKTRRKSLVQKRKTLNGIAKRKSLGKIPVAKAKPTVPSPIVNRPIKRRTLNVEHRCDCGQLFSSAALLSRHTVLAHTPPRIRRNRSPPPEQTHKKNTTKNKTPEKTKKTDTRKSLHDKTTRRTPAHKKVPVPEKVRKLLEKNKK